MKDLTTRWDALFFFLFLLVLALFFFNFWFADTAFFERDSGLIEIPTRQLCVELLKQGDFALWSDAHGNGQPFLANPKHAVLYPSTWLYLILPFFWAFKLHYLLHFLLAWIGTYYLSRGYGLSPRGAFLACSVFIFSGMFLSSVEFYNHIAALCWLPWILLVWMRMKGVFLANAIRLALLWSLMILAGAPYVIVITLLLGCLQLIFVGGRKGVRTGLLIVSLGLAVLLTAIQVYPAAGLMTQNGRDLERQFVWSLQPLQLFNLTFPHFFGNDRQPGHDEFWGDFLFHNRSPLYYSLYVGFGAILLALAGLKRPWDGWQRALFLSFCVCLFLALGSRTPLGALQKILPPFSYIRFPAKYLMGAIFSLALLSGMGFERLLSRFKTQKGPLYLPLSVAVILLGLFLAFKRMVVGTLSDFFVINSPTSSAELARGLSYGFWTLLIFSACLLALTLLSSQRSQFAWILPVLVLVDLFLINRFINPVQPTALFKGSEYLGTAARPLVVHREERFPSDLRDRLGSSSRLHRFLFQSQYVFSGLGDGIRYVYNDDFYGLNGEEYNRILDYMKSCSREEYVKILASAGCQFHIGLHPLPDLPAREERIQGQVVYYQTIPDPVISPRLVNAAEVASTLEGKLGILARPDFEPGKTAIVERSLSLGQDASIAGAGRIDIQKQTQGYLRCTVVSSQPALLVQSGNLRAGWEARLDGRPVDILRVNLTSKGMAVPAGSHEVELRYRPRSFIRGAWISGIMLLVVLGTTVFLVLKKRS